MLKNFKLAVLVAIFKVCSVVRAAPVDDYLAHLIQEYPAYLRNSTEIDPSPIYQTPIIFSDSWVAFFDGYLTHVEMTSGFVNYQIHNLSSIHYDINSAKIDLARGTLSAELTLNNIDSFWIGGNYTADGMADISGPKIKFNGNGTWCVRAQPSTPPTLSLLWTDFTITDGCVNLDGANFAGSFILSYTDFEMQGWNEYAYRYAVDDQVLFRFLRMSGTFVDLPIISQIREYLVKGFNETPIVDM